MKREASGGFTLIELLVVVALIMVMYVMAYGPAQKSYQEKQLIACQKNLLMIQIALKIYAADYHDSYPVVPGSETSETPLSLLVPRDTTETAIFICPGSARRRLPEAEPFTHRKISYAYYMGHTVHDAADATLLSDAQLNAHPRHTGEPMFSVSGKRPADNHRQFGGNVLFCDGHAEQFPAVAPRDFIFSDPVVLLEPGTMTMNIVVNCACQTAYEFEVEPVNGQMPGQVSCPTCGADGTDYANSVIQEALANQQEALPTQPEAAPKIKLRRSVEEEPASGAAEEAAEEPGGLPKSCFIHKEEPLEAFCLTCKKPICLKCMKQTGYFCSIYCRNRAQQAGMDIPVYAGQDRVVREREYKRVTQVGTAILVGLVALFITYEWYVIFGQQPSIKFTMPIAADQRLTHAQFVSEHELLLVSADSVSDYDFKKKQALWSTSLATYRAKSAAPTNLAAVLEAAQNGDQPKSPEAIAAQKKLIEQMAEYEEDYYPADTQLHVVGNDLWLTVGRSIVCLDRATGAEKVSVPTEGRVQEMTFGDNEMIVVSAKGEYERVLTHVQLPSGEQQTERRSLPRTPPRRFDMDMEAAREPYIPDDRHEFVATGSTVVDLDVKLAEKKIVTVDTMKAAEQDSKKFENLGVTQTKEFAEDVMNEMKRSRSGGTAKVDQSRYAVTLQRVFGKDIAPWTGEVIGSPSFFAMKTVDVLVAGNVMYVFDKNNQKLWQSTLSYPIAPQFIQRESASEYDSHMASAAPCVERDNALYLFDRGVLTAFDAQSGAVRWRMPSVGISNIQFDDKGMLYVSTTSGSPESIQYSDQVSLDKVDPVIVKVDPANGKALWHLEKVGDECHVAGKYLYSTHVQASGGLMSFAAKGSVSTTFHLFRLNPRNGKQVWDYIREGFPGSVDFRDNQILLRFEDRLEVLKFLAL